MSGFIKEVLEPCGNKYINEIIYRYLLTLGDALGGKMRNIVGSIAEEKFTRSIVSQLQIHNIEFDFFPKNTKWVSGYNYSINMAENIKSIRWKHNNQERSIIYNINVPQVKKNIDIVMLDEWITGISSKVLHNTLQTKTKYLAMGELKGGIDPAGADEHWKTANSALGRVRQAFNGQLDLFFIGAAIETEMAREIFTQYKNKDLANVANLTIDNQLIALCEWLVKK